MLRTVGTISDAAIGRTITIGDWTGTLTAVTPCASRARLRIALDGGADLLTGWLDLTTPLEIHAKEAGR